MNEVESFRNPNWAELWTTSGRVVAVEMQIPKAGPTI